MRDFNMKCKGPYNSKEPFTLNYATRYSNLASAFSTRAYSEITVPESADYYLLFCSREHLILENSQNTYTIPENSFIIYKPSGLQQLTMALDSSFVHCIFSGTNVRNMLRTLGLECDTTYQLSPAYVSVDDILYFNKQLEHIQSEYRNKELYYKQKITALFQDFLVSCARHIKLYNGDNVTVQIKQIIKYIKKNIERPLNIDELVKMSNLSRSRFYHVFKEHTGTSPIGFQQNFRLNVSKDYLAFYPDWSIARTANFLGFNDPLYFSKLFKKEYGISPSEYRKELNKKKK